MPQCVPSFGLLGDKRRGTGKLIEMLTTATERGTEGTSNNNNPTIAIKVTVRVTKI